MAAPSIVALPPSIVEEISGHLHVVQAGHRKKGVRTWGDRALLRLPEIASHIVDRGVPQLPRWCKNEFVDIFDEIADERRQLADQISGLTEEQRATPSLCSEWSVQDVAAHLIVPLEVSIPKFMLAILASRGNFDRANTRLARRQAQRPYAEIVEILRRKADTRFTPPGAGPEAPLTDVLVHGLDIRWPLELTRQVPAERLQKTLTFLASTPAGLVSKGTLDGLRLEASDIDWARGDGARVGGEAEALLLVMTGRKSALQRLHGEGVATLRGRLS